MKKRLAAIFLAMALLLTACGAQKTESKPLKNQVVVAELTERERAFLGIAADKALAVDFVVDESYKQVKVWVEKYVFGEQQNDGIGRLSTVLDGPGTIVYVQGKPIDESGMKRQAYLGVVSDSGLVSSTAPAAAMGGGMASLWGELNEPAPVGGAMVLGDICYSDLEVMRSLTTDFYADPDAHMDELKPYAEVYLLRCEFIK